MATNFFSQFPKLAYDIDGEGSYVNLTNISRNVDISNLNEDKGSFYTYYDIMDGDRPDTISQLLYQTPQYYWSIFILNDSLKAGLNNAWPLSALDFETMIGNEYDKYSSFAVSPQLTVSGSIQQQRSDFSVVPLNEKYLPYLFLSSTETELRANILKYDRRLLQAVVYNITPHDAASTQLYANTSSLDLRNIFLSSSEYILEWINPFDSVNEATEYAACEVLKEEWIDLAIEPFKTADVAIPNAGYNTVANGTYLKELYIFSKKYLTSGPGFTWPLYRNAAYQYFKYDTLDSSITYPVSAFNLLEEKENTIYISGDTSPNINGALRNVITSDGQNSLWTNADVEWVDAFFSGEDYDFTRPYDVTTLYYRTTAFGFNQPHWRIETYGANSETTIFAARSEPTDNSFSPLNLTYTTELGSITICNLDVPPVCTTTILRNGTGTPIVSTKFVGNPSISNYEKEQLENDAKRKIKVVRPDIVRDFTRTYFTLLNS